YTSCIKQFSATVKAKTVNEEIQLQALVDGKKILITKSTVRRDLQLEDAKGVDCLPNDAIFEQLTLIGRSSAIFKTSLRFVSIVAFFSIIAFCLNREPDLSVPVPESLHEQTDEELTETDIKRMDADDQA
nr:hypothetical protein [Tanacetum cinerariifolium]